MSVKEHYDKWSESYDQVENKTRDLEANTIRTVLEPYSFDSILEAGCGTGKNSEWLLSKTKHLTCADFSEEMLAAAKQKLVGNDVSFVTMDITKEWQVTANEYDLVTFSLVLEHVKELKTVFAQAARALKPGGIMYLGELHPFKQYTGSKARFDDGEELVILECFTHNISEYYDAAEKHGLHCTGINEWFDKDGETAIPRVLTMLFKKS